MRGEFEDQGGLFSYIDPESRIPAEHPLRRVRSLVRAVLKDLSRSFGQLYSHLNGRPAVANRMCDSIHPGHIHVREDQPNIGARFQDFDRLVRCPGRKHFEAAIPGDRDELVFNNDNDWFSALPWRPSSN